MLSWRDMISVWAPIGLLYRHACQTASMIDYCCFSLFVDALATKSDGKKCDRSISKPVQSATTYQKDNMNLQNM